MTKKRIIIITIIIILIGLVAYFAIFRKDSIPIELPNQKYYSKLTGKEVSKDDSQRPILAIMVENSEEARPQTGLSSAGIVFETTTEAGITRYLTLFQEDMPEIVGPIRSVRPQFVDWLMGFDASVAHVGGSAPALEMLDDRNAKSLNEFRYGESYYRDNNREAPHNMYARTEVLRNLQKELEHNESNFDEFNWTDGAPAEQPVANTITVNFSHPSFATEYRYDATSNTYTRYLAGQPHIDAATNKPITVKNLIVLKMRGNEINAIGSGEALLFKDGNVQEIRWETENYDTRVRLLDSDDNDVSLNRGNSWFSVIPISGAVNHR